MISFLFGSVLSIVPDKAIFGKWEVACTIFSSYLSMLILSLSLYISFIFNILPNKIVLLFLVLLIFGGSFFLVRNKFLNIDNQMLVEHKMKKISRLFAKVIGISFIVFCFISFIVFTSIVSRGISR